MQEEVKKPSILHLLPLIMMMVIAFLMTSISMMDIVQQTNVNLYLSIIDLILRIIGFFLLAYFSGLFAFYIFLHTSLFIISSFISVFVLKNVHTAPELFFSLILLFHWLLLVSALYAVRNNRVWFKLNKLEELMLVHSIRLIIIIWVTSLVAFFWGSLISTLVFIW